MIQYTIRDYGVMPDNERYFVGFGLENTANNKEGYVQAYVAITGNTDKSESQICNLAFSGAFCLVMKIAGLTLGNKKILLTNISYGLNRKMTI